MGALGYVVAWLFGVACGGAATIAIAMLPTNRPLADQVASTSPVAQFPAIMDASSIDPKKLSLLRQTLQSSLYDPLSAQLSGLTAGHLERICGQLNAKNRMGGYIGFRVFAFDPTSGRLEYLPALDNINVNAKDAMDKLNQAEKELAFVNESCRGLIDRVK